MNDIAIEILIIFLLLIANGIFAMSEIAIVSARKARLQQLADRGNSKAGAALKLAKNPNQFLSTAQVGITLIGILAGAFSGATIAEKISAYLSTVPFLKPHSEIIGFALVVITLTYFSLIIGELVPKRLALGNAEKIASFIAMPMKILSNIVHPVVWLLSFSTDIIIGLLGIKPSTDQIVTEEEIKVLIGQGTESGIFEETEQDMIENLLRLDERKVGAFMTPRPKIVCFDVDETSDEIRFKIENSRYSRYPVIKGNMDDILGVVRTKDLLVYNLANKALDLKKSLRPALLMPESMSALKALEMFKRKGSHIALVINEYGGIEGLITHNDILEAIVGDIPPSSGEPDNLQAIRRDDGSWLFDGGVDIDKLKQIFNIKYLPDEETGKYQTVAGFVLNQIRRIPHAGEYFVWKNLRFEVVDMDSHRVDKVLVMAIMCALDDLDKIK